ncbi:MAG TPA: hypothetical protein VJT72_17565, partial [Pseudonocardiaceae bacterium]|nr:hypothetical protein [Pseudonocardiaceae bacterium]
MTGTGGPVRPNDLPWSLELLADLHAGALTGRAAARLRSQVATDPQASAVLAALDATVADLATLPAQMPDAVAQRLDAALAVESSGADRHPPAPGTETPGADHHPAAPTRLVPRRPTPREPVIIMAALRRLRARWIGAGVLAAAVTAVVMIGVLTGGA